MSNLVGNPKAWSSRVTAHLMLQVMFLSNLSVVVILNLNVSVPIFSSPEPLGSQGRLIGWP